MTVTLGATDNLSGVALTQYRLDGGDPQTYTGSFTVSTDAVHRVDFYSTDNAGNIEAAHSQTIRLDKTKPVLTVAADPSTIWPPNGKMVSVKVWGSMTDLLSGIDPSRAAFTVLDEYGLVQPHGTIKVRAGGTYCFKILLQAGRNGQDLDGRHYTITVAGQDLAGNSNAATTVVIVPHDQGQRDCSNDTGRSAAYPRDQAWNRAILETGRRFGAIERVPRSVTPVPVERTSNRTRRPCYSLGTKTECRSARGDILG